jgi:photosystem II stability/assembly factor-like uncharacterized protein
VRQIANESLNGVACHGNLLGWAAGSSGFVAHTVDGGQSWATQTSHLGGELRAIHFGSTVLGVVAGDGGALAVTNDAGATWRPIAPLTNVSLRGATVAAEAGLVLVVGDGGTVLRSADSGATWKTVPIAGAADFRSVATDDFAHLVLAVDGAGAVWASSDAGLTWGRELIATAGLESVSIDDSDSEALVAGKGGLALRRDEHGNWITLVTGTQADLHAALVSYDDGHYYLAGDGGTLLVSTDHGLHWTPKPVATTADLFGLDEL